MYIHNFKINNFRGIEELTLSFAKGTNVIIGENNSGKTSIIDALRLCLQYGNQRREVYLSSEDFFVNSDGEKSDTIDFDITFGSLSQEEKGVYIEMLSVSPESEDFLKLHLCFTLEERNGIERIRSKLWGGDNEGQSIPQEVLELLYHVHLDALRDANRHLSPNRGNRLGQLFMKIVSDKSQQSAYAEEINDLVKNNENWTHLLKQAEGRINDHLSNTTLNDSPQRVDISFIDYDFRKIVEGLKIFIPFIMKIQKKEIEQLIKAKEKEAQNLFEDIESDTLEIKSNLINKLLYTSSGLNDFEIAIAKILKQRLIHFEVFQNGLGYNNLIYIATVLGDIFQRAEAEKLSYIALLIEEPEAHLHPQLQNVLFNYFKNTVHDNIQVFISSHSPSITSKTDLNSVIVMQCSDSGIKSTALRSTPICIIEDAEHKKYKRYLQRFLDVTKCQLFFARGVILVEGISEALLLPVFANCMGIDKYNLDKNGIEVVNVCGVAFAPFSKLFNSDNADERLNIPCSVMTDDDRKVYEGIGPENICARAKKALNLRGECLEVFLAERTFEYELFKSNEGLLTTVYKELHPRTNINFSGSIENKAQSFVDMLKKNEDKAVFAQSLAEYIQDHEECAVIVPDYIQNVIRWVVDGS